MKVFVVRHGKAEAVEIDPEKGLSQDGRKGVGQLANLLREEEVDRIFHSGKLRAEQTAEILAEGLGLESPMMKTGLKPNDDAQAIADDLEFEDENVMLVGHLPFVDVLANLLLPGNDKDPFSIPTATAIILENREGEWHLDALLSPNL